MYQYLVYSLAVIKPGVELYIVPPTLSNRCQVLTLGFYTQDWYNCQPVRHKYNPDGRHQRPDILAGALYCPG